MNEELHSQFLTLLEASSSFKLLSHEQQAAIRANYESATDEQLNLGIQALKEDQEVTAKLAAESKKNAEELEKKVIEAKGLLREIKKDKLIEAEAADDKISEKEMQGVLHSIDSMGSSSKTDTSKPRKKFLGIF